MSGQCQDMGVVEIYLRKLNALSLGAAAGESIDAELDYTLKAAVRHLSIWGPGVRAVNLRALMLRLEQTLSALPSDCEGQRQVLRRALDRLESLAPEAGQRAASSSRRHQYQSTL